MKGKLRLFFIIFIILVIIVCTYLVYKVHVYKNIDENTRIVVIYKTIDPSVEFWQVVKEGIYIAAEEFGVSVSIKGRMSETDIEGQINIIEEVIKSKPAAIVLVAADYNRLVPAAEKIKEAGIKLITIDSGINSDLPESFIATDNVEAGRKAGKELSQILKGNSEVVIISHVKGAATAIEREKGVRDSLTQYTNFKILDTYFCDNNKNKAYIITKELLISNKNIEGIVCLNEVSTLGAAKAVKELGLKGKVKLVGFDNSIEEIKLIEQGVIQATIVQNPFNMGYRGIETAVKAIRGEKVSKRIDTGSVVVTKENMYNNEIQKLIFPFISRQQ